MEGLNDHLKEEAERQQQMAGGGGAGGNMSGSAQNVPVSGDIAGFAGVQVERVETPES